MLAAAVKASPFSPCPKTRFNNMAVSTEYKAFVLEQLAPLGQVRIRNMFGGAGVYYGDLMFGLIAGEVLYFKADEINRPDFEAEGTEAFVYAPPSGKTITMSYWEVPERLYDEPEELTHWARNAIEAAVRGKKPKPKKKRKTAVKKAVGKK